MNLYSLQVGLAVAVSSLVAAGAPLRAQEAASRSEEQARQQQEKAQTASPYTRTFLERRLLAVEQAGGFGGARGLSVTFGDIKAGSNIALGPAYGRTFDNGAVVVGKAVYSLRNFKLLQVSARSPRLSGGRLQFRTRARWQDAPNLDVFALGPDSPGRSGEYAERKTELSGEATLRPVRILRFSAGTGYEWFDTSASHGDERSLALFPELPGANADPDYLHCVVAGAVDSRDGDTYARRGTLVRAELHDYRQQNSGNYSFQRIDGAAEQYVPVLHGNWVLYFGVHASTTSTSDGDRVPFFLMPDLGGRDLRGYPTYRFRDRHSINITAEYRWYAQEYLDAALFYDAGKTVPRRGDLDFSHLKSDVGFGVRLHTPRRFLVRVEVARGREGFRFVLGFSPIGG